MKIESLDEALEIGVDEAGRGAVLGPMVLAVCGLAPSTALRLRELGVADSKAFGVPNRARARRSFLAAEILRLSEFSALSVVPPEEVDIAVRRGGLNALERRVASELLEKAPRWSLLILDGFRLFGPLAATLPAAVARDRAESTSVAVAAASILAKNERDRLFAKIRASHEASFGTIRGEGYPNAATARFLAAYYDAKGELPSQTRRSWAWPPVATRLPETEKNAGRSGQ